MAHDSTTTSPFQRRAPPELRERAVRLVAETAAERGDRHGAVTHVARQLGIGPESLRHWVHPAEVDRAATGGLTTEERERIKLLERKNRELRRANEILKSAAAFFGAELDRRSPPCPGTSTRSAGPVGATRFCGCA